MLNMSIKKSALRVGEGKMNPGVESPRRLGGNLPFIGW